LEQYSLTVLQFDALKDSSLHQFPFATLSTAKDSDRATRVINLWHWIVVASNIIELLLISSSCYRTLLELAKFVLRFAKKTFHQKLDRIPFKIWMDRYELTKVVKGLLFWTRE